MAADSTPGTPVRSARPDRVPALRPVLGRDSLRAFESYFAAEQRHLLAQPSFHVASMLPDHSAHTRPEHTFASSFREDGARLGQAVAWSVRTPRLAREAEAADGRPTVGALHVAQAQQTSDGTYLERLGPRGTQPWVDAARDHGLLLIVDTQIGWSDTLTATKLLEPLLKLPFVHLALDPGFATNGERLAPGKTIGTIDAAAVNDVQAYLGGIVRREGLPRKMLMVHQFRGDMITNPDRFVLDPDIEVVVDMDGFGSPGVKLDPYEQFALAPYSERPGIKLFFEWDEPIMTPAEWSSLKRPPDLVVYQ